MFQCSSPPFDEEAPDHERLHGGFKQNNGANRAKTSASTKNYLRSELPLNRFDEFVAAALNLVAEFSFRS